MVGFGEALEEQPEETYEVEFICDNCGIVATIEIPKETFVEEVEGELTECPNCGCDDLSQF